MKAKNRRWLFFLGLVLVTPLTWKLREINWVWLIIMGVSFWGWMQGKKWSWFFLVLLVVFNLVNNRLLSIETNPIRMSFDSEQSFWNYPGLRSAISRYYLENTTFHHRLKDIFYTNYLLVFPWITSFLRFVSPGMLIRILGLFGITGIYYGIKKTNQRRLITVFVTTVLASSGLRVIGDDQTAWLGCWPAIVYLYYEATEI